MRGIAEMENESFTTPQSSTKKTFFQASTMFARVAFFLSIALILLSLVYILLGVAFLLQFGKYPHYIIGAFFLIDSLIGIIFGSFSFRKAQRNVFGILGFIFSLVLFTTHIYQLVIVITAKY